MSRDVWDRLRQEREAQVVEILGCRGRAFSAVADHLSREVYGSAACCRRLAERIREGLFDKSTTWVYFVGKQPDGAVKIGFSHQPARRLYTLQISQDVELKVIAKGLGGPPLEGLLHRVFAPDHIRGEWFRRSETLIGFTRALGMGDQARPKRPPPKKREHAPWQPGVPWRCTLPHDDSDLQGATLVRPPEKT